MSDSSYSNTTPDTSRPISRFLIWLWVLLVPALIYFEIDRLDLTQTIGMNRVERSAHFRKIAMPGFSDDYLKLLNEAKLYLGERRVAYDIVWPEDLSRPLWIWIKRFTLYVLSPSRPAYKEGWLNHFFVYGQRTPPWQKKQKPQMILYYRTAPPDDTGYKIVKVIKASVPSYILWKE